MKISTFHRLKKAGNIGLLELVEGPKKVHMQASEDTGRVPIKKGHTKECAATAQPSTKMCQAEIAVINTLIVETERPLYSTSCKKLSNTGNREHSGSSY